jgi:cation:H+ antiporter
VASTNDTAPHALPGLFATIWPMGGVLSASLLIAWATEVLSFFLSRGLAFAVLALLQVLPEFAVEAVITTEAAANFGQEKSTQYVTANFTGANRLIVGLFVPLVFIMHAWRRRSMEAMKMPLESSVEVVALIIPTLYSFFFVLRGNLQLWDAIILIGMYLTYLVIIYKLPPEDAGHDDLPLVPRKIRSLRTGQQKFVIFLFFLLGGTLLFVSVHPFYENTLAIGAALGIPAYFLLQWLAPFLSEFPEFITILYWGKTGRSQLGLTNAISSKVNQWTLLIAMIPIVYIIAALYNGHEVWQLSFDSSQRLEVLLTAAQGLFAASCFLNLRFHAWEAITLIGLWAIQLFDPLIDPILKQSFGHEALSAITIFGTEHYIREWTTIAYLLLTLVPIIVYKDRFAAIVGFKHVWATHFVKAIPIPPEERREKKS